MSFKNIGNILSAGNDFTKLSDAVKVIGDLTAAAEALKKVNLSDDLKVGVLVNGLDDMDAASARAALGITDLGNSMANTTKQSGGLGAALKGMFATNPVGSIITSVTAVIGIISMIKNAYDQYKQGLIDQATEATTAWNNTTSSLEDYASKYQELRAQLDSGDLSEAETVSVKEQILDIQNQITDQYGEQAAGIDLVNGKLETQLGIIQSISSEEAAKNINNNLKAYEDAEYEMNKTRHYYLGSTGASIYGGGIAQEIYDLAKSAGIDLEENGPSEGVYNMYLDVNAEKADVALNDFITGLRDLEKQYEDQGLDIPYELSDVLSYTTGEFERNNEVLENYRDNYNAYLQQQMYEMDQGDLISKYSDAIENYNKALSEGDPSAIEEAKTAFEEADAAKNEFLSTGSNSKFSRIFDDLDGQLDTARIKIEEVRSVLEGGDFEGTWASKLAESISGMDLGEELRDKLKEVEDLDIDAVDVEVALNTDGVQEGEETIRRIAEILDFDLTSDEEVQALINLLVELGIVSDGTGVAVSNALNDINEGLGAIATNSQKALTGITAVMNQVYAQSTGKSISYEDFTSEELADYTSALEYNNGALQLNAERVRELAKAKSEEQIAANDATKAEMQATYLDQAAQIAELTQKLEENNFATGESADSIQSQIDALYSSNDAIAAQCTQIDVLNQGLREATGEYQNWLNAQNATETGDMFSDAVNAMQAIRDTANVESEDYGRIGTQKYMAAVEFVVPDSIDSEDSAAVQSYLDSISYALTRDEEGMITGLNLQGFLEEAVNQGLMTVTDGQYQIAGQMTMEQFAEGMNMSLPLVQAIFGELQEFTPGGEGFNWADEAYDNLGDAFVATEQSIAAMKQELDTLDPNVDTSRIEELNSQLQEAEATKEQLSGEIDLKIESSIEIEDQLAKAREEYETLKAQLENDPTNIEILALVADAESKIQLLEADKEALGTPTQTEIQIYINNIDAQIASIQSQIDQLSDSDYLIKVGLSEEEAASQISSLQTQMQGLEDKKVAVTGDTSDADSKMNAVEGEQIQDKNFSITANATQALNTLTSVRVSLSNIQSKTIDIKTRYSSTGTPPATGAGGASGTAHVAGTAHKYLKSHGAAYVRGNAKLQGDWGTDVGQRVLIGELGPEIVVDPRNGRWRTYGDNGAEFAYIPQDAIIFNHEQSKSLLERGFVNGRGTARAYGTAMVTGGISVNTAHKVTQAANNRNNSSTSSKTYDNVSKSASKAASSISDATEAADEFEETLDWIEIAIDRIERAIDKLSKTAGNTYELFTTRNNALSQQISKTTEEINLQQRAYDRYIQEANSVGLSEEWAVKVRNGLVDIEDITDENLKNLIDDYSEWCISRPSIRRRVECIYLIAGNLFGRKGNQQRSPFIHCMSGCAQRSAAMSVAA